MTTLTGLHGGRGSGKDTAFRLLHEWLTERGESSTRRGFADALKLSFARLFIPSIQLDEAVIWCDELKQDADLGRDPSFLTIRWGGASEDGTITTVQHQITGRQALQRYGTEAHRDVFDDDFWVNALLPTNAIINEHDLPEGPRWPWNFVTMGMQITGDVQPPAHAFVTDTRFPNEAARIRLLGGKVYGIKMTGRNTDFMDGHSSEIPLDDEAVDRWISNPWGDPEAFQQNLIDAWLEDHS